MLNYSFFTKPLSKEAWLREIKMLFEIRKKFNSLLIIASANKSCKKAFYNLIYRFFYQKIR